MFFVYFEYSEYFECVNNIIWDIFWNIRFFEYLEYLDPLHGLEPLQRLDTLQSLNLLQRLELVAKNESVAHLGTGAGTSPQVRRVAAARGQGK